MNTIVISTINHSYWSYKPTNLANIDAHWMGLFVDRSSGEEVEHALHRIHRLHAAVLFRPKDSDRRASNGSF